MSKLIGLALGVVGGYALARAIEARAHGMPVSLALRHWSDPVVTLKMEWLMSANAAARPVQQDPYDRDGVLPGMTYQ